MSWSLVNRNWSLFSPIIAESWDALTSGDMVMIDGDRTLLIGFLSRHYSLPPEIAERRIRLFVEGIGPDEEMPRTLQ